MTSQGMIDVPNPSELFLSSRYVHTCDFFWINEKKKKKKTDGRNEYYIYKCLLNLSSNCYSSDVVDSILYNII